MKLLLRSLLLALFTITFTSVNVFSQSTTIATDQLDYPPGSTAIITGTGFQPGETVTLQVLHEGDDGYGTDEQYHQPFTAIADANGNVSSTWWVPDDGDAPGATFTLTAVGGSSGLKAEFTFTDANTNFSYLTTSGKVASLITTAGTTDNTTLSVNVTAAKNNGSFNASLSFTPHPGTTIGIGAGPGEINLSSVINSYNTTSSDVTKTFPVTVAVGSDVPDGTYTFDAIAISNPTGMTNNKEWTFEIKIGSTPGSIGTVSVAAQSTVSVYGIASTPTFAVTSSRSGNGTVNGTYSVSGLPAGVTSAGFAPSATFTAGGSTSFPDVILTLNVPANLNAGSYDFTVLLSDGGAPATTTGTLVVNKADQTILFNTLASKTYGDASFNLGATASSGLAITYSSSNTSVATVSGNTVTIVGAGSAIITASQAGNDNYNAATNAPQTLTVNKADQTITWNNPADITYGTLLSATQLNATVSVPGSETAGMLTYTPANGTALNAGTSQDLTLDVAGSANYNAATKTVQINVNKANPAISVTPYTNTYNGNPHTATYAITGVNGETGATVGTVDVSATTHTNAGTYNGDAWTFTGAANYNNTSGTVDDAISKANPTVSVTGYSVTYDGNPHTATYAITGVNGETGATVGTIDVSATTHTNAGTYNGDAWTFTGAANYNNTSGTVDDAISKANPTVSVTGYSVTYDGNPHTATYAITGVNGETGATVGTVDVSATTHTNAGTYNGDAWTFTGAANYNNTSGTVDDAISKANPTVSVTGYSVTYDGNPHTATYAITGVNGETGATVGTVDVSATTHTNAGTYNGDAWTFTGAANYNNTSGTVDDAISKANPTVSVTGYSVTYDGNPHTATYAITGVNGETGATVGTVDVSATTHTNAGTYNGDAWTFTGAANYNNTSGTVDDAISKANPTVSATGYSVTYDGNPHTATYAITGVNGETGATVGTVDVSATTHTNAGTYNGDAWTFTGAANYNNTSGTVDDAISKANPTVSVTGYSVTYDGNPHTATYAITGVNGETGATVGTVDVSATTHTNAGTYNGDAWTFTGAANYNNTSGTVDDAISKANPTVSVTGYSVTYDGNPHTATYAITGVNGETGATVGTVDVSATTHTNAGTYNGDAWTFTGAANYNNTSGTVDDQITARPITITPNPGRFKYCGQADPTFTFSASEDLIAGNTYIGSLGRTGNENSGVGSYQYTLGTLSAGSNYELSLGGSNVFEIKGVSIDASASSVAIQINTSGTDLKATATNSNGDPVEGVSVTFTVNDILYGSSNTNASGIATLSIDISTFPIGLYKVVAVAGSGCANSTAYMTIYDPNGNFITGGGWITSPQGALVNKPSAIGKANFGFNAKYKKGNNQVDGNTEFQFQQGDFNFKSSSLDAGTLVISGAKGTYRGVGTVNGTGDYGFMVSAVDGQINGGGGTDLFRIKIWDRSHGNTVVYDNDMGKDENGAPTTVLGGGSIVIHNANGKNSTRIMNSTVTGSAVEVNSNQVTDQTGADKLSVRVMPNPTSYYFTAGLQSKSKEDVKMVVTDITGRVIEQRTNIAANSVIQLGNQYRPGIYIAQFLQGTDKVTLRLIKEGK